MLHMAMERHFIGYNSREIADRKCHQRFCRALFAVYLESDKMTNILCTDHQVIFSDDKERANSRDRKISKFTFRLSSCGMQTYL